MCLWQTPPKPLFPMALWKTSHYISNRLLMSLYRRAMVETVSPALFEERRQKKKPFSKLFTKPLVLRFATVASIVRISSGRGGKKLCNAFELHLENLGSSWRALSTAKRECFPTLPHPPFHPLPALCQRSWYWGPSESLITRIFSAVNTNKKSPNPTKTSSIKGFFPPFRRGANIVQRGLLLTVLTSSNLIQYS